MLFRLNIVLLSVKIWYHNSRTVYSCLFSFIYFCNYIICRKLCLSGCLHANCKMNSSSHTMYFCFFQQYKTAQRVSDVQDTLAAEWESFEKLIQAGNDGQSGPIGTEQNVISASTAKSSDLLKERVTGGQSTDQTFASKVDTRQKRVFREVESNSDHSSNADSEDESGPTLPGPGVTSSSNYKTSHHSSSSESSQSDDKFQATASLSEDDSSSDDDKPVETKSSFGKCHVSTNYRR